MTYSLIVLNAQGASDKTTHPTLAAVEAEIRSWADPKNLDARVFDSDGGRVYEGRATGFWRATQATSKAAAAMGRAGKGAAKVRGDAAHYRALAGKSVVTRRAAAAHRDGTCRCAGVECSQGHPGAEGGHCPCGDPLQ